MYSVAFHAVLLLQLALAMSFPVGCRVPAQKIRYDIGVPAAPIQGCIALSAVSGTSPLMFKPPYNSYKIVA
jgi:hypothetical protein